jgi:NTP pyrophosphatase (non-canonical NTP hydrolase)
MNIKEFQKWTNTTAVYPPENAESYLHNGLAAEVGEFLGVFAKQARGDYGYQEAEVKAKKEFGDVLWFVAQLAELYEWEIEGVLDEVKDKLESRKIRGVLKGSGDNR